MLKPENTGYQGSAVVSIAMERPPGGVSGTGAFKAKASAKAKSKPSPKAKSTEKPSKKKTAKTQGDAVQKENKDEKTGTEETSLDKEKENTSERGVDVD